MLVQEHQAEAAGQGNEFLKQMDQPHLPGIPPSPTVHRRRSQGRLSDHRITARINHMTKLSTTLITIQVTMGK
jgi:hypothetical protein